MLMLIVRHKVDNIIELKIRMGFRLGYRSLVGKLFGGKLELLMTYKKWNLENLEITYR